MLTHRTRLLLIGGVIVISLGATLLIETPEPTVAIDDLMVSPELREGDNFAIRGQVLNSTIDNTSYTFVIHGEVHQLLVDFSAAMTSNGLDDGRTVYAEGTLVKMNDQWTFQADIIKTSCPSKYDSDSN